MTTTRSPCRAISASRPASSRRVDVAVELADVSSSLPWQLVGLRRRSTAPRSAGRRASPSTARSTRSCPCGCRGSRSRRPRPCRSRRGRAARAARSAHRPSRRRCRRASRSICGRVLAAAARIHAMRSGKPASARFFQQTSWKALRAPVGAHAVDLDDDEAELGEFLRAARARRPSARAAPCGRRRSVLDHRVRRADRSWSGDADDAPDVGRAVAALGDEALGRAPAAGVSVRASARRAPHDSRRRSRARSSRPAGVDARPHIDVRRRSGENSSSCVPSPSVSTVKPAVEFTRAKCTWYGSGPRGRGRTRVNQTCRFSSSTSLDAAHDPLAADVTGSSRRPGRRVDEVQVVPALRSDIQSSSTVASRRCRRKVLCA
jgi:hypothetical protein